MKRSGPLKRSPLKRETPLKARSAALRTSKPLAAESPKRRAERPLRDAVRAEALRRAGHRCQAISLVPEIDCGGPLDVDEIEARSARPGGHLDVDNTQVLCRAHHAWRHQHPIQAAERGLRAYPIGYMGPRKGQSA